MFTTTARRILAALALIAILASGNARAHNTVNSPAAPAPNQCADHTLENAPYFQHLIKTSVDFCEGQTEIWYRIYAQDLNPGILTIQPVGPNASLIYTGARIYYTPDEVNAYDALAQGPGHRLQAQIFPGPGVMGIKIKNITGVAGTVQVELRFTENENEPIPTLVHLTGPAGTSNDPSYPLGRVTDMSTFSLNVEYQGFTVNCDQSHFWNQASNGIGFVIGFPQAGQKKCTLTVYDKLRRQGQVFLMPIAQRQMAYNINGSTTYLPLTTR